MPDMFQVWEMIFKNLDIVSLLNCRHVSRSWNAAASTLLRKRPVWIKQKWDSETCGRLYKCVKSSNNFPFCGLDLSTSPKLPANINYDSVTKLLTGFGTIFTHLRVVGSHKWRAGMLRDLLTNATQVQHLEIDKLSSHTKTENDRELSFPTLRILSLCHYYKGEKGLVEIIRAAPGLQEIRHVHCDRPIQMAAISKTQKLALGSVH